MKKIYHGIAFECSALESNGMYRGFCAFFFHNNQYSYVIKKSVNEIAKTKEEAENQAIQLAKNYIERGLF